MGDRVMKKEKLNRKRTEFVTTACAARAFKHDCPHMQFTTLESSAL